MIHCLFNLPENIFAACDKVDSRTSTPRIITTMSVSSRVDFQTKDPETNVQHDKSTIPSSRSIKSDERTLYATIALSCLLGIILIIITAAMAYRYCSIRNKSNNVS